MSNARVILCPGQGAQQVGMGRAWFERSPEAAQTFAAADEVLGDRLGARLSDLCFRGPADTLNRTDVSQPALYAVGVACHQALVSLGWEGPPAATAGLSLGEYTALHLAGAFSFEDGLELVALRGRAMQDAAEASRGGMVALIGAEEAQAIEVCGRARDGCILVVANLNAPGQVVLSGDADACERAVNIGTESGFRATRLQVAGAFHSPLMAPAAERLQSALAGMEIKAPACPVVSNVTGRPHEADGAASLGVEDSIRNRLAEQLTSPVRWSDCCSWLVAGVSGDYHELAPGKVLSGLMRRIARETKVTSHDQPM